MEWYIFFTIVFALFFLMALGVPIAVSMATVSIGATAFLLGPQKAIQVTGMILYSSLENFLLVAIPLFILMAEILIMSGLVTKIYDSLEKVFGVLPGGLMVSTVAASTIFAALSGSSIASTSTIGSIALPEMKKRGYDGQLAVGCIAAGGGLAIIIPPSILFILYGFIAEISVAKLFIAGIIPGLLMSTIYSMWIIFISKRNPEKAPRVMGVAWKDKFLAILSIWPVLVLLLLVLGSIYLGFSTPTEAAALGVLGSLLVTVGYRRLSIKGLYQAVTNTVRATGFILFIIIGALLFGFVISYLHIPQRLSEVVLGASINPYFALIGINLVLLALGCAMEASSLILVVTPIILPTLVPLGFDPVALGLVLCINIETALLTPPVGMNLFILQGLGKSFGIEFNEVVKGALPYVFFNIIVIGLVVIFPQLAVYLPSIMYGK